MRFAVLGPTQVWDGDRQVELGPMRRRLLLAALLVDVGRVVSVDALVDRVWDGQPSESATTTLHSYVSRLRGTLQAATRSEAARLTTTARGYLLDVSPDDVDARAFEALLAEARRRHADQDLAAARDVLDQAQALWRGGAYLDFDAEFAVAEAARLNDLRLDAYELAAELDLALGRHVSLTTSLRGLVAEHPFRESLRGQLMLALYGSGRQAEALQVYAEGRELLAAELGVDPDVAVQQLHARILRQDPGLESGEVHESPQIAPAAVSVTAADRLIGRSAELESLIQTLARSRSGETQFAALVGEAGIGKSRLAEEVGIAARSQGDAVAWGRCWQHEGAPALWPWVQIVRDLAAQATPDVLARVMSGRGGGVTALVPELAAAGPSRISAPSTSVDHAELYTFDALVAFFAALAAARPMLVVLDDMQWADPTSRRLLEYMTSHVRDARICFLVTVRSPTEDDTKQDLAALATLARHASATRIDLPPLTRDDIREFVRDRAASELDERTTEALHARTGGNPFYVGEIVRLVAATGTRSSLAEGVPDTVRGVIRRRIEQLSEPEQRVLRTAAIVGRTFDLDLLAAVTGYGPDDVDSAVDRATALGLVRSEPDTAVQHRFTHALLQEALLDETGPSQRRRAHRRIAEVLQARRVRNSASAAVERIGHHFAAAGADEDLEAALESYLTATDEALERGSYAEVEPLLRTALDISERLNTETSRTLGSRVRSMLSSFYLTFDGAHSTERRWQSFAAPTAQFDASASSRDVLTALFTEWGDAHGRNMLPESEAASARMSELADARDDDLLRVGAAMTNGYNLFQRGRLAEATAALADLDLLLPKVTIPGLVLTPNPVVAGPLWRGMIATMMGEPAGGQDFFAVALRRSEQLGDPVAQLYYDTVDVFRWVFLDDAQSAVRATQKTAESISANDMGMMRMYLAMPNAWVLSRQDAAAGLAMAEQTSAGLEAPDDVVLRPFMRGLHADVLLRAGQSERALAQVDSALAESARTGTVFYDAELQRIRAACLTALGELGEAAAALERGRATAASQGASLFEQRIVALIEA